MAAVFTGQLSKSKGKHKSKSPIKCSVSSTKIIPSWLKSRRSCYVEKERLMYSVLFAFTEWLTYISDKSIDRNVTCYINLEKHLHTSIYAISVIKEKIQLFAVTCIKSNYSLVWIVLRLHRSFDSKISA